MDKIIDNEGYYQDVDDARYEDGGVLEKCQEYKPDSGLRVTPERYAHIEYNPLTKGGRRKFCEARDKIHSEARKQYEEDIKNNTYGNLPPSSVFVQCKNCKGGFIARVADRKRGWAKFCSKSCKAQAS